MSNLMKLKNKELKSLLIEKLSEINDLIDWSSLNEKESEFNELINPTSYWENRKLIDPEEFMHRRMAKGNYVNLLKGLLPLIEELNKLKEKYMIDKGNSNQFTNDGKDEKSNLDQSSRGGKREGAGRKGIGVTKKVSLTLSPEIWERIEKECENGKSQSLVLREIITESLNKVSSIV